MKFIQQLSNIIRFLGLPRAQRRLVYYSEGRNYWPHMEGLVREFLNNSDAPLTYVTSDRDDPGLNMEQAGYNSF